MGSYGEYIKSCKENELNKFFGEIRKTSNKYFKFNRIIDNDNIIIVTNNVRFVKGNPVLLVDNNKVVYLKDWNIKAVRNYYNDIYGYAVKLSRQYFKVYTFRNDFDDVAFEKEESFDDLYNVAVAQQNVDMAVALD